MEIKVHNIWRPENFRNREDENEEDDEEEYYFICNFLGWYDIPGYVSHLRIQVLVYNEDYFFVAVNGQIKSILDINF